MGEKKDVVMIEEHRTKKVGTPLMCETLGLFIEKTEYDTNLIEVFNRNIKKYLPYTRNSARSCAKNS